MVITEKEAKVIIGLQEAKKTEKDIYSVMKILGVQYTASYHLVRLMERKGYLRIVGAGRRKSYEPTPAGARRAVAWKRKRGY